jgi:hypothetical protein
MISLLNLLREEEYENKTFTGEEIADYIAHITPDNSNIPVFFLKQIIESGKVFKRQIVSIAKLLSIDQDLKSYVESEENRYDDNDEYVPDPDDLNNPIVIFNNEVVDGYSRIAEYYRLGEDKITAYVSQK